jgi:hypothetical protein
MILLSLVVALAGARAEESARPSSTGARHWTTRRASGPIATRR